MNERGTKPRIVLFSPLCYPPAGSEAIVTSKLLLAMIEDGWEVFAISQSDFGHFYPAGTGAVWAKILPNIINISSSNEKGFFESKWLTAEWRSLPAVQSLTWVVKAIVAGYRVIKQRRIEIIFSRATPQYGHLPALVLSLVTGLPWIAHWSDPIPQQKAPPPYGKGIHAQTSYLSRKYCNIVARVASHHLFPCERLRKYMGGYIPSLEGKSSVIPHIALHRFTKREKTSQSEFTICHVGSLYMRNPSTLLLGIERFVEQSQVTNIKVRFIGAMATDLESALEKPTIGRLISLEPGDVYEKVIKDVSHDTLLAVIEAPCAEGIFFPSKFVDYVQTGRPIISISPTEGTMADILKDSKAGLAVDCTSPEAVADAIEVFYREWQKGTLDERFDSMRLFDIYSEETILDQYLDLIVNTSAMNRRLH